MGTDGAVADGPVPKTRAVVRGAITEAPLRAEALGCASAVRSVARLGQDVSSGR